VSCGHTDTRHTAPFLVPLSPPPVLHTGLGTSSAKEAKEYFAAMEAHRKNFVWEGEWPSTSTHKS
jgi:hypothetical protein